MSDTDASESGGLQKRVANNLVTQFNRSLTSVLVTYLISRDPAMKPILDRFCTEWERRIVESAEAELATRKTEISQLPDDFREQFVSAFLATHKAAAVAVTTAFRENVDAASKPNSQADRA